MLNLNLLPPKDKENIRFEERRRLVVFTFLVTVVIFVFLNIFLLPAYFITALHRKSFLQALEAAERSDRVANTKKTESTVIELNRVLEKIKKGGKKTVTLSDFIEQMINDTGGKIFFSQISYKSRKEISIGGFSPTRNDLLAFEKKISGHEFLKNAASPITNIVKESNINFTIKATPLF